MALPVLKQPHAFFFVFFLFLLFTYPSRAYGSLSWVVTSDQGRFALGLDQSGRAYIDASSYCPDTCVQRFAYGGGQFDWVVPPFDLAEPTPCLDPTNGLGTMFQSVSQGVCNAEGDQAFYAVLLGNEFDFGGIFLQRGNGEPFSIYASRVDLRYTPLFINDRGDVLFDDIFTENWIEVAGVPEPSTLALLSAGLCGLFASCKRK